MAEGARLESVFTGNRNVGSNPTPSATTRDELQIKYYWLGSEAIYFWSRSTSTPIGEHSAVAPQ